MVKNHLAGVSPGPTRLWQEICNEKHGSPSVGNPAEEQGNDHEKTFYPSGVGLFSGIDILRGSDGRMRGSSGPHPSAAAPDGKA